MGQRAECAMGGGVAVAAHHGHARQGPALFRPDNMHDALTHIGHRVIMHAEIFGVFIQSLHLNAGFFGHLRGIVAPCGGWHVVVRHGDGFIGRVDLAARHAQAFERLRAGDLVDQMAVDIQKAGAVIGFIRDMGIPDFIIKGLGGHVSSPVHCCWYGCE